MIYLDYAANHPADPDVLKCFLETEQNFIGNYNSNHIAGFEAKKKMGEITKSIADLLKAEPEELIYTSGATEANNLALKGIARASRHIGRHIISTPLEHSSSSGALTWLKDQGYEIDLLNILRDGTIDLEQLQDLLRKDTIAVAITLVDSELGTIQPLEQIKEILKAYPECKLHVDATQAVGRVAFDLAGIDTLSMAPHKFGGLNGSGLLFKRKNLVIEPQLHGGASTSIYRSGTPALALAASMELALKLAMKNQEDRCQKAGDLSKVLKAGLLAYPKVRINSPMNAVPHILNVSVEGVRGTVFQKALSDKGVCVSVKSACSTDATPSRAVFAVSRDRKNALSSWRISLSHLTTKEEIDEFLHIFDTCYQELILVK